MTMRKNGCGWAVVTDFDGTVTTFDIGDAVCLYFKVATRDDIERSYDIGMPVDKWVKDTFSKIRADLDEMERYVLKSARLRPGFANLARYCLKHDIPCRIASGGLDGYIKPLLKKWKLHELELFCGQLKKTHKGFEAEYPMLEKLSLEKFKTACVESLQKKGHRVIFCGDGTSDRFAAARADEVFATGRLYAFCRKEGIRARKLTDFNKLLELIRS